MVEPRPRRQIWLLVAILLVAVLLRVAWPTLTEFKFSEARLEALALELTREGRLPLVGVPSSAGFDHSPLSVYFYVPAFLLTTNPIPATIYGGLVGAAAVALCWLLTCRWPFGGAQDRPNARPIAALLAAGLLAVNPWAVAFSRKIWQVTFVPLLALLFVGLAISALVGRRHRNLAWALAVYAVLVQVHPSAIGLAPALLLWLLLFWREVRLGPLLAGGGLGLLSALPFLAHQVQSGWPAWRALQNLPRGSLGHDSGSPGLGGNHRARPPRPGRRLVPSSPHRAAARLDLEPRWLAGRRRRGVAGLAVGGRVAILDGSTGSPKSWSAGKRPR